MQRREPLRLSQTGKVADDSVEKDRGQHERQKAEHVQPSKQHRMKFVAKSHIPAQSREGEVDQHDLFQAAFFLREAVAQR